MTPRCETHDADMLLASACTLLPQHHSHSTACVTARCRPICAAEGREEDKAALIAALADLRRTPSPAARRSVLSATTRLEARSDAVTASAEGRWALLFSTQLAPEVGRPADALPLVQPLIDATYATFFKLAPALAGAQQDGGQAGGGSNEQRLNLETGVVENRVRVPLPASLPFVGDSASALEIRVDGLVAPDDGADKLSVQFTECGFRLLPRGGGGDAARGVTVPLPRPVGSLRTTFCDESLRVSRGGRGGVFVLKRLRERGVE